MLGDHDAMRRRAPGRGLRGGAHPERRRRHHRNEPADGVSV
jgi:hypothetical protein